MFANQDFTPVYAQQILKEVLAQVRSGEKAGKIQPSEVGWVDDELAIYEYCQPTGFKDLRNIDRINAMAFWLSNVLVRVMPNSEVRKRAIDLALEEPERLCESVQC
jgi:hypothetical protein